MRAGIAVIADLPGHGQRFDATLQDSRHVLEVIRIMLDELDSVAGAGLAQLGADPMRTGIEGMSAGGMVAIARLTRPGHPAMRGSGGDDRLLGPPTLPADVRSA